MQRAVKAKARVKSVPLLAVCVTLLPAVMALPAAAQGPAANGPVLRMPQVQMCATAQGKPRPVYMCASKGPTQKATMGEAETIIIKRQSFNICHTKAQGPGYSPTVGWGTYIDTPEKLNAGKCPAPDMLETWFKRDLATAFTRGQAQAQALRMDNACMARTLTAINHQVGDLQRKYPDTWKKLADGQLCAVALNMLTWSWYQQSCDRTLDTVLALDNMGQCLVAAR